MTFRKFRYPFMFRLLGFYSNFLCKRYVNEFSDFRKIIKSSYLRAQKELWELPLHRYIRNGLLMGLKVFLECFGTIWILFFKKTIKFSGLTTLCQSFDKSYGSVFSAELQFFDELISQMKNPNHFGISLEQCSMCIVYRKNTAGGIRASINEKFGLVFFSSRNFPGSLGTFLERV